MNHRIDTRYPPDALSGGVRSGRLVPVRHYAGTFSRIIDTTRFPIPLVLLAGQETARENVAATGTIVLGPRLEWPYMIPFTSGVTEPHVRFQRSELLLSDRSLDPDGLYPLVEIEWKAGKPLASRETSPTDS